MAKVVGLITSKKQGKLSKNIFTPTTSKDVIKQLIISDLEKYTTQFYFWMTLTRLHNI